MYFIQTFILLLYQFHISNAASFDLNIPDKTINANTTYTLNITRNLTTTLTNITLQFPNIINFASLTSTINYINATPQVLSGTLIFSNLPTSIKNSQNFIIQLSNVINPGYSYYFTNNILITFTDNLNSIQNITYTSFQNIVANYLRKCQISFANYVNSVGNATITLINNDIIPNSSNNSILITFSNYWSNLPTNTATQKGFIVTGNNVLNSILVNNLSISGATISISSSQQTQLFIILSNPTPIAVGSIISFNINNVNTPPTQITSSTSDTFGITILSPYGSINSINSCSITNTPVYTFTSSFSKTNQINTNSTSIISIGNIGSNQIWSTNDQIIITYPSSINFNGINRIVFVGQINNFNGQLSSTAPNTQYFNISIFFPASYITTTKPFQSFNLSFNSSFIMPSNTKPVNLTISFSRKSNNYYMQTNVTLYPTAGTFNRINGSWLSKLVGTQTVFSLQFVNQNQISINGGIIIIFPIQININSTVVNATVNGTAITSIKFSIVLNTITISNIFTNGIPSNIISKIDFSNIYTPLSTVPLLNFNITTYDNINDLSTMIDTNSALNFTFISNIIPDPINITSSNPAALSITNYTITYKNGVQLLPNTKITLQIPPQLTLNNLNIYLSINNILQNNTFIKQNSFNLSTTLNTSLNFGSVISISLNLTNPNTMGLTSSFSIYQTISGYGIQYKTTGIYGAITSPSLLTSFQVYLGATSTGSNTLYRFVFQPSINHMSSTNSIIITFPPQIIFSNLTSCFLSTCSNISIINSTSINVAISYQLLNTIMYQIKINNILNPRSIKPTKSISFMTQINNLPANVGQASIPSLTPNQLTLSYSANSMNYYLSSQAINVTITRTSNSLISTDYFYLQFSTPFYVRNNQSIVCQQIYWNCTQFLSGIRITLNNNSNWPSNLDFNIIGFNTSKNSTGTIVMYSIDSNGYYIDYTLTPLEFALTCGVDSPCKKCSTINHYFCYSCYSDNTLSAYNFMTNNNLCTNNCSNISVYYYPAQNQCVKCQSPCVKCSNKTACLSCQPLNYLNITSSSCLSQCPNGFYTSVITFFSELVTICSKCRNNCKICSDYNNCSQCQDSLIIQLGKCVVACSINFYIANATSCNICDQSCFNCSGISSKNCYSCKNSSFYLTTSNQCVSKCPYGTVLNVVSNICNCSSNCSLCADFQTNCIACISGYFLYYQVCIQSCPKGTFMNSSTCSLCTLGCLSCTSQLCLICYPNFYIFNGSCYADCSLIGKQYQNDNTNLICVKCPVGCNTCNNLNLSICLTCLDQYALNDTTCVLQCLATNSCNKTDIICASTEYFNGKMCVQSFSKSSILILISFSSIAILSIVFSLTSKFLAKQTFLPYCLMPAFSVLQILCYLTLLGLVKVASSKGRLLITNSNNQGIYCIIASIVLNYLINLVHLLIYNKYIKQDIYFYKNKRNSKQHFLNIFLLIFATLTNFRFYQIIFSSLCNFKFFRTQLINIAKLTPLNILNYINIAISVVAIAGSILIVSDNDYHSVQFLTAILTVTIIIITLVATLLSFIKNPDFFKKDAEGGQKDMHQTQQYFQEGQKYQFYNGNSKIRRSENQTLQKIKQQDEYTGDMPIQKKQKHSGPLFTNQQNLLFSNTQCGHKNILFYQNEMDIPITQKLSKITGKKRKNISKISIKQQRKNINNLQVLTNRNQNQSKSNTIINKLNQQTQSMPRHFQPESDNSQILDQNYKHSNLNQSEEQILKKNIRHSQASLIIIKSRIKNQSTQTQNQLLNSQVSSQKSNKKGDTIDLNFVQKFYQQPTIEFSEPQVPYQQISPSYFNLQNQRYDYYENFKTNLISTPRQSEKNEKLQEIQKRFNKKVDIQTLESHHTANQDIKQIQI